MPSFISNVTTHKVGHVPGIRGVDEIKNEPMLFNADMKFARENGGPLTKEILCGLNYKNLGPADKYIINTRVTMCMSGQYPSIPGWHGDNVPRSEKYSQPDFSKVDNKVRHALCLISSAENHSNTEFLNQEINISYNENKVWESVDSYINGYDDNLGILKYKVKEGDIIEFGQLDMHRATEVKVQGWRLFFRISNTGKAANEIRNQVQIYVPLGIGW